MEDYYQKAILEAAILKLNTSKKALSESDLTRGIVAILKKKLGKDDLRHSSKIRFRKDSFKHIIDKTDWKENIVLLDERKFYLKEWIMDSKDIENNSEWNWHNVDFETAHERILKILKMMDPFKLENLVKEMIEEIYDYEAEVTRKTGDMGVDVIGFKDDPTLKNKKQAIYVQVKGFNGTVNRDFADKFVGAVKEFHKKEKWSKFEGLFVTTGRFPDSFRQKLDNSSETGINFFCWDGKELVDNLIKLGWGINYSVDLDFWNEFDPSIIPKELQKK